MKCACLLRHKNLRPYIVTISLSKFKSGDTVVQIARTSLAARSEFLLLEKCSLDLMLGFK